MIPYNVCENKWLSNTKKVVKNNWDKLPIICQITVYMMVISIFVLGILTAFKSFL